MRAGASASIHMGRSASEKWHAEPRSEPDSGNPTVDSATNVSTDCSADAVASTTNTLAYRGSDAVDSATDCSTNIGANTVAPAVPNVSAVTTTNRNTDASNDTVPNRTADRNHCVLHGIA